jgi:adenylate cyclase
MGRTIRFEKLTMDLERMSVAGPAGTIDLRPKSFEVLRYFAEHARRIVTKDEVLETVWSGVTVTDESLTRCVSDIRRAISDDGQRIIRTVPRRGYLFDPVDLAFEPTGDAPAVAPHRLQPLPVDPSRTSIAVLPFRNLSGDPEQEYFADGITEDLITDLAKLSGLHVIARNTAFTFKDRPAVAPLVASELRVGFVLEGSVRKAGAAVRVTVQLVDGPSGRSVWAERYDRELRDIFSIQDEITRAIVHQLRIRLLPEEQELIGQTSTRDVEAYSYYLRGREFLHRRSKPFLELARRMFDKAIDLDPSYAKAYAGVADCDSFLRLHYGVQIPIERILATSARALDLQAGLAEAHASRGLALSLLGRYSEAMAALDEALAANPGLFEAHYFTARACLSQGWFEQAAHHFKRAAEIHPDDCQTLIVMLSVLRKLGRHEEMMSAAREGVARAERELVKHPENPRPAYLGAGALAILGEVDRGREWAARALVIDPDDVLTQYNGACFYAMIGEIDRAIDLLLGVLPRSGLQTKHWVRNDSDLDNIRSHPRYGEVLKLLE